MSSWKTSFALESGDALGARKRERASERARTCKPVDARMPLVGSRAGVLQDRTRAQLVLRRGGEGKIDNRCRGCTAVAGLRVGRKLVLPTSIHDDSAERRRPRAESRLTGARVEAIRPCEDR